jgi:hypothetical protein
MRTNMRWETMEPQSSCEELNEDEYEAGDYGAEEVTSLEKILWPQECLQNVYTYTKNMHKFGRERKAE